MIEEKLKEFDKFADDIDNGVYCEFESGLKIENTKSFLLSFYKQILEEDIKTMEGMLETEKAEGRANDLYEKSYSAALSHLISSKREALNKLK